MTNTQNSAPATVAQPSATPAVTDREKALMQEVDKYKGLLEAANSNLMASRSSERKASEERDTLRTETYTLQAKLEATDKPVGAGWLANAGMLDELSIKTAADLPTITTSGKEQTKAYKALMADACRVTGEKILPASLKLQMEITRWTDKKADASKDAKRAQRDMVALRRYYSCLTLEELENRADYMAKAGAYGKAVKAKETAEQMLKELRKAQRDTEWYTVLATCLPIDLQKCKENFLPEFVERYGLQLTKKSASFLQSLTGWKDSAACNGEHMTTTVWRTKDKSRLVLMLMVSALKSNLLKEKQYKALLTPDMVAAFGKVTGIDLPKNIKDKADKATKTKTEEKPTEATEATEDKTKA